MHFPQSADLAKKRILFSRERLQASEDFLKSPLIESCANLPDVNQPPLLVKQAKHERAEIIAAALGIGVASDDTLLPLRDF